MKKINNIKKLILIFKKNVIKNNLNTIIENLNNIKIYDETNQTQYLKECYAHIISLFFLKQNNLIFDLLKINPLIIDNLYELFSDYLTNYGTKSINEYFFSKLYNIYDKAIVTYNFAIEISKKIPNNPSLGFSAYFIDDLFQSCFIYFEEKDCLNLIKISFENINISNLHSNIFTTLCYIPWSHNYWQNNFTKNFLLEIDDLLSHYIKNIINIEYFSEPISQLLNSLFITEENFILNKNIENKAVKTFIDIMIEKSSSSNIKNIFLLLDEIIPLKYLISKIKTREDIDLNFYIKEYLIYHPDLDKIKAFI